MNKLSRNWKLSSGAVEVLGASSENVGAVYEEGGYRVLREMEAQSVFEMGIGHGRREQ